MIHINSNKGSNMLNRRARAFLQSFIIMCLLLSIAYTLYINNSLQAKLKNMDIKAQRYQAQHQSLSSQLQVVYEDRSRLENSLQKEKSEHQNTHDELQHQKETHEQILHNLKDNHEDKLQALREDHAYVQNSLSKVRKNLDAAQEEARLLKEEKDGHMQAAQNHEREKNELKSHNSQLQEQNYELQEQQRKNKAFQDNLLAQLDNAKNEVSSFNELKGALRSAGADVLKLDHSHFDEMGQNQRMLLFSHLGGSPEHATQLEKQREQLKNDQVGREAALMRQQQQKAERDRQLAWRQATTAEAPSDICTLLPLPGDCKSMVKRYYYDPRTSSCMLFPYTGCGGNANRFETLEGCESVCAGSRIENAKVQPSSSKQEAVEQPGDLHVLRNPGNAPANPLVDSRDGAVNPAPIDVDEAQFGHPASQEQHPVNVGLDQQDQEQAERESDAQLDPNATNRIHRRDNEDAELPGVEDTQKQQEPLEVDDDNAIHAADEGNMNGGRFPALGVNEDEGENAVALEEAKARDAEMKAREEYERFENSKDRSNEQFDPNMDADGNDDQGMSEKLNEIQRQKQVLGENQVKDMEKVGMPQGRDNRMEGVITEEEEEMNRLNPDEMEPREPKLDNQVLQPPAVKVVEDEKEPVIDVPGVHDNRDTAEDHLFEEEEEEDNENYEDGQRDNADEENKYNEDGDEERDVRIDDNYGNEEDNQEEEEENLSEADHRHEEAVRFAERNGAKRDMM